MTQRRHYTRAPITEALVDLRAELPVGTGVSQLASVQETVQDDYPARQDIKIALHQIRLGEQIQTTAQARQHGFMFTSRDEKYVVQVRLDGFTLSRLAPYQDWPTFRAEARRLWDLYRVATNPVRITRLAVRYVNRLDLPLPITDFKEYLTTVPEVSPGIPQGLAGFFMQLNIPLDDVKAALLLTEALIEPARPGLASIVLDLDVFRTVDLPTDEPGTWAQLDQLSDKKNEIFERCITDKMRSLIE